MNDEPLYCSHCGAEDFGCDCEMPATAVDYGPYCESCGVVPAPGKECKFMKRGGRNKPCESEV